jgi:hypothetical protein
MIDGVSGGLERVQVIGYSQGVRKLNVFKKGDSMTDKVVMYLVYLALSISLTMWVGRTLSRNGKVFLQDAFDDERLAGSVNHLLVVGFYLLNLGYVSVAMRASGAIDDTAGAMEELSLKVGLVLLVLGIVHFFNLYALSRYRRSRLRAASGIPPLPPTTVLPHHPQQPAQPLSPKQVDAMRMQFQAQQQFAQQQAARQQATQQGGQQAGQQAAQQTGQQAGRQTGQQAARPAGRQAGQATARQQAQQDDGDE